LRYYKGEDKEDDHQGEADWVFGVEEVVVCIPYWSDTIRHGMESRNQIYDVCTAQPSAVLLAGVSQTTQPAPRNYDVEAAVGGCRL
jgi:hypothetical protein